MTDHEFHTFWQHARSIRLTAGESADVQSRISIAIGNPVRVGGAACPQGRMDPKSALQRAEDIRLSLGESERIHENILHFARTHPIGASMKQHNPDLAENLRSFFFGHRLMPVFSVVIAVIFALGTSLSAAAKSALPGDFLYPIKVHVNENVQAALRFSADARAQFEAQRLENRLEEAGQLAASGRLHGDAQEHVSRGIDAQLARIQRAASALTADGNAAAALDLQSHVESDLIANAAVLGDLAATKAAVKADVQNLLRNVSHARREAVQSRIDAEAGMSAALNTDVKTAAEGSVTAASNTIEDVRAFILKNGTSAQTKVLEHANARLTHSKKIFTNARMLLNAEQYTDAFHAAKEAQRSAQEATIMLKVSATLQPHVASASLSSMESSASSAFSAQSTDAPSSAGVAADSTVDVKKDKIEFQLR